MLALIKSAVRPVRDYANRRKLKAKYSKELNALADTYIFFREHPDQSLWGSITDEDEAAIRAAVKATATIDGPIIEVGALFGHTTELIATIKPASKRLIAVENFSWNPFGMTENQHRQFTYRSLRYCLQNCDTEIFDGDSETFFAKYNQDPPSLVFIDAGHSYEEVRRDISMACDASTAVVCGHDYSRFHPGVIRAVDERFGAAVSVRGTVWRADNAR